MFQRYALLTKTTDGTERIGLVVSTSRGYDKRILDVGHEREILAYQDFHHIFSPGFLASSFMRKIPKKSVKDKREYHGTVIVNALSFIPTRRTSSIEYNHLDSEPVEEFQQRLIDRFHQTFGRA